MPNVISLDGSIRQDNWVVVPRPAEGESLDIPADQPALIPADLWLAGYEHFTGRQEIGVVTALAGYCVNVSATRMSFGRLETCCWISCSS